MSKNTDSFDIALCQFKADYPQHDKYFMYEDDRHTIAREVLEGSDQTIRIAIAAPYPPDAEHYFVYDVDPTARVAHLIKSETSFDQATLLLDRAYAYEDDPE